MGVRTRRPGIRDVADAAGVSATTVSHVLNGVAGARVSDDTRQRVRDAAARLGYTANRLARGLRTQRSELVGLLTDHVATTPHAGRMILGAQEAAAERGWTIVLFNTGGDHVVEERDIQTLLQQQVDGVIYAPMYHRVVRLPSSLQQVPTVLVNGRTATAGAPAVVPDEVGGGREATQALLDAGHRRIGFALNRDDIPATHGRLQGYREALAAAGVEFEPKLVVKEESESSGGYRAVRALLRLTPRPTAVFCFNDRMAMGAYRAAAEAGLQIPRDLSVIGFDDQQYVADGLFPALTTMALPHYEMGAWAVRRLLELVEQQVAGSERVPAELLPCPLVPRDSVAPPPATR